MNMAQSVAKLYGASGRSISYRFGVFSMPSQEDPANKLGGIGFDIVQSRHTPTRKPSCHSLPSLQQFKKNGRSFSGVVNEIFAAMGCVGRFVLGHWRHGPAP